MLVDDNNVDHTTGVMAWEDRFELHDTIGAAGLDATQEGRIGVALVVGVAIAVGNDTGVDTSGIAVLDIGIDVLQRLTSVDIDQLQVQEQWHTLLVFGDVAADEFTGDIVWPLGNLRLHDASPAVCKQDAGARREGDVLGRLVVRGQHRVKIAHLEVAAIFMGILSVGACSRSSMHTYRCYQPSCAAAARRSHDGQH
ncbi:hypothetical protein BDV09DRAFT_168027 [Aspergillus tetrazonus]